MTMNKALSIAGSDASGGAGIQADLKTFELLGVYGMTALTIIATMDPKNNWNHNVFPQDVKAVEAQLDTILSVGVDAMKTGMLGTVDIIELVGRTIDENELKNIVIDPVMVCKGTDEVLNPETAVALREILTPRATVITPNLFEAGQLSQIGRIRTVEDMKKAAVIIHELGAKYVLIKGGSKLDHEKAIDLLYDGIEFEILESEKVETAYTHGAGCTYSAAITAELAKGTPVKEAIYIAKEFISQAIRHSWKLNQYVGPVLHGAYSKYGTSKEELIK